MSSKGRKPVDAPPNENYPTEAWCVHALLDECPLPMQGRWLEPCAGEGAIVRAVKDWCPPHAAPPTWDCVEIRKEGFDELCTMNRAATEYGVRDVWHADYLQWTPRVVASYSVIITNPSFSIAQRVIEKSFAVAPEAHVVMLQRLNFLGSAERNPFWVEHPPDLYTLGKNRPTFRADGRTDSIEYGWYVWPPGNRKREFGKLKILRGGRPPRRTR